MLPRPRSAGATLCSVAGGGGVAGALSCATQGCRACVLLRRQPPPPTDVAGMLIDDWHLAVIRHQSHVAKRFKLTLHLSWAACVVCFVDLSIVSPTLYPYVAKVRARAGPEPQCLACSMSW